MRKSDKTGQWFPSYIDGSFVAFAHLSTAQIGAFHLLHGYQWRMGKLPHDMEQLARISRQTRTAFVRSIWPALQPYYVEVEGGLVFQPLQDQREHARGVSAVRANAAYEKHEKSRGEKSRGEPHENSGLASANAGGLQPFCRPHLQVHSEEEEKEVAAAGTRLVIVPDTPVLVATNGHTPPQAKRLIEAFDEARAAAFGDERRRGWPSGLDGTTAQRWIALAAEHQVSEGELLTICTEVFIAEHAAKARAGAEPPAALKLHETSIARAIAERHRPVAAGGRGVRSRGGRPSAASDEELLRAAGLEGIFGGRPH